MKYLELKIPPLALTLTIGLLMWLFSSQHIADKFNNTWSLAIAFVVLFTGAVFAIWGVIEFRKAKTTVDPRVPEQTKSLVVSGVYRLSRNPMYIGFLFMLTAWSIFLSELQGYLFLPMFIFYMNCFQIAPEERFMKQKFGEEYSQYISQVRRWI